jgi:choline dehydrogenase-like flavoprotein
MMIIIESRFFWAKDHPLGTAAMLPESDGGVVDPEVRVYGTTNVRIADASVIPMHVSAHTTVRTAFYY